MTSPALLHLDDDPDSLAAVQYCVSELIRNVLEHSGSADGAFVCAHSFESGTPRRVAIGVADCGIGIPEHLGEVYPRALTDHREALVLAMQPGITGVRPGMYGTPENAGAGLFITRSIAKGTGGYFLLVSGRAGYRLRRTRGAESQAQLFADAFEDRHDAWAFENGWKGTVVALEIGTDEIGDFNEYFRWIRERMPRRVAPRRKVKFT